MAEATVTNVIKHQAGSELDADASLGATQILVVDIDEFDADGGTLKIGTETHVYTVPEDSTGLIDLAAPGLGAPYTAGEPVMMSPPLIEYFAFVKDEDQEEELQALVRHDLIDSLPLGLRNGDGEQVEIDFRGEALVVIDILGKEPLKDGSFIEPGTVPGTGTDGDPPLASPAPTVRGALGALVVNWNAIGNADPVTYEIHLSASSGFTPSPATFATETDGTLVWLRTLPGGAALEYPDPVTGMPVYYVLVIAKDADGQASPSAEASGQPAQITGPDIAADTILANHILAGEITSELLASVLILATLIQAPAAEGQRIEIGAQPDGGWVGIRLIDQGGDTTVELPTAIGSTASFRGALTASSLTVLDRLSIRGTNNVIDAGVLTLSSQLANPASPPGVEIANDTFQLSGVQAFGAGDHVTNRGLFYDPNGYTGVPTILSTLIDNGEIAVFEHAMADGAIVRPPATIGATVLDGHKWDRVCGVTRRGNIIYVLGWRAGSQLIVTRLRQSDFALLSWHTITPPAASQWDPYRSTISSIAGVPGSVFMWSFNGKNVSEEIRRDEYTDDNSLFGAWTHAGAVPYHGRTFDGQAGGDVIEGHVRFGGSDWISTDRTGVHGPISFDQGTRDWEDETGFVASSQGLAHDGTRFLSRAGGRITLHTDWDWSTDDPYLVYAYAWRSEGMPDTPAAAETLPSPLRALNVRPDGPTHRAYRRNRIKITVPSIPPPAPKFRLFMAHSSSASVPSNPLNRQPAPTVIDRNDASPAYQFTENPVAGQIPAALNDFPGATSKIKSQTSIAGGGWELSGTSHTGFGTDISCVLKHTGALSITNNVTTAVQFNNEIVDTTGSMHSAGLPSRIVAPAAGKYWVYGRSGWVSQGSGYRQINIRKNGAGTALASDSRNPVGAPGDTFQSVATEVVLAVNDYIELTAFQNGPAGLNINTGSGVELGMIFLGP